MRGRLAALALMLATPAAAREDPAAFVLGLYACFNAPRGCDPDLLHRPVDAPLRELVLRDIAEAGGDIPLTSNGDAIGNCQECAPLTRLRVVRLTRTRNHARVIVRFNIASYERRSEFWLVRRSDGWRIADIVAAGAPNEGGESLVQLLKQSRVKPEPR